MWQPENSTRQMLFAHFTRARNTSTEICNLRNNRTKLATTVFAVSRSTNKTKLHVHNRNIQKKPCSKCYLLDSPSVEHVFIGWRWGTRQDSTMRHWSLKQSTQKAILPGQNEHTFTLFWFWRWGKATGALGFPSKITWTARLSYRNLVKTQYDCKRRSWFKHVYVPSNW